MRRLHLRGEHRPVEPRQEAPLVGEVRVERGRPAAVVVTAALALAMCGAKKFHEALLKFIEGLED